LPLLNYPSLPFFTFFQVYVSHQGQEEWPHIAFIEPAKV
jgi:hypothetical protein